MRRCRALIAVALCSMTSAHCQVKLPVLDEDAWELRPDWIGDAERRSEHAVYAVEDGIAQFSVPEPGKAMSVRARMEQPIDLAALPYIKVRYRAVGVTRAYGHEYFLYLHSSEGGGSTVIRLDELLLNGKWHTQVFEPHSMIKADEFAFHVTAGRKGGELQIASVEFLAEYPILSVAESLCQDVQPAQEIADCKPVALVKIAEVEPAEVRKNTGLSDWFAEEALLYDGVRYELGPGGRVAAIPTDDEGELVVPCSATASELHFIMATRLPNWQPRPFTHWGVRKRALAQVERFSMFLDYADGTTDQVFPYCPDTGKFELCRGLKMYAVPSAAKPLKAVRFSHDVHEVGRANLYLCALTAWTGQPLHAAAYQADMPARAAVPRIEEGPATVKLEGDEVLVANAYYSLRFGLKPTFRLLAVDAEHETRAAPTLFSARRGLERYLSDGMSVVGEPRVEGGEVTVRLQPPDDLPALFELKLRADESPELAMELTVTNRGDEPLGLEVAFPHLRHLRLGDLESTWCFFPSHCARLTRANLTHRWAYGGRFPLQFYSVFDPALGRGIYVCTRDLTGMDRNYWLSKRFDGIEARIDYPASLVIEAGGALRLPRTVIGFHPGDWHEALDAYRTWARSWYLPGNHRPEWFRRVTNMRTYWLQLESNNHRLVYDRATGEYRVGEILDEDERRFGRVDYAHFFDYRISKQFGRWGDYDEFSAVGGEEGYKRCLRQFEQRGCRVGLYLEGFLASANSKIAQAHGEEWRINARSGKPIIKHSTPEETVWAMCPFMAGWRKHLADVSARLVQQFDVDGIYLDEFGFNTSGYFCYRDDHGHPVPGRPLQGVIQALREVKEALPDDVALYTEETPADVASRHCDGSFSYFLSYNDPPNTPGRLNTYRFAFPEFRILAYSAHGVAQGKYIDQPKFVLFNGLGFYGSGIIVEPQGERLSREVMKVLQDHREAFNSAEAEPLVPTEARGILVNRFPGRQETVFTVFNTHYHTVRCPVLRLETGGRCEPIYDADELSVESRRRFDVVHMTLGPRAVACFSWQRQ